MSSESLVRAAIELPVTSVKPGGHLAYRIRNSGPVKLTYGLTYSLETESGDGWVTINRGQIFPLLAILVSPGDCHDLSAKIPADAPPGQCRISTEANGLRLAARFEVVRE